MSTAIAPDAAAAPATTIPRTRRRAPRNLLGPSRPVALVVKAVVALAYLIPLLWIVVTSFKSNAQILSAPNSLFFAPSLDTYGDVIGQGVGSILTSLQVGVFVTLLVLALAVPAAYALATRISLAWTRILAVVLGAFLVLQMVPQPMTVIPLYSVLAGWGLLGTLAGLIFVDVALLLPFAIMLLRPFVLSIPTALYEAAEIDGASRFQTFRSITIPMLGNGIATVVSVIFISAWGEFVYAINFLPLGTTLPVSGLLANQISIYSVSWNRLMALAVLTSLPLLIVFIVSQKRLVNGLSLGAVK